MSWSDEDFTTPLENLTPADLRFLRQGAWRIEQMYGKWPEKTCDKCKEKSTKGFLFASQGMGVIGFSFVCGNCFNDYVQNLELEGAVCNGIPVLVAKSNGMKNEIA